MGCKITFVTSEPYNDGRLDARYQTSFSQAADNRVPDPNSQSGIQRVDATIYCTNNGYPFQPEQFSIRKWGPAATYNALTAAESEAQSRINDVREFDCPLTPRHTVPVTLA